MPPCLTLRAGPAALRLIREHGLRADDVDIIPGASGGAKWLALGELDRFLFGEFLQQARRRPVHLIGSSIGSWRLACLAQHDPVAALARGNHGYTYNQNYTPRATSAHVTAASTQIVTDLLGPSGVAEILSNPTFRLHIITVAGRGLAAREHRLALSVALVVAAATNALSRRALTAQFRRHVFHTVSNDDTFRHFTDLPTTHAALTSDNLRDLLVASGSIPLLLDGVRIAGTSGGVHWDGGVIDYHLDLDFGSGNGLILYPHFYDYIVPGWFDKALPWRRATSTNFQRVLLVAPSAKFVRSLRGGKIPDRDDFHRLAHSERTARWQGVLDASAQLGEELRDLILSGNIAERVRPW